jgi:hypothetical protein
MLVVVNHDALGSYGHLHILRLPARPIGAHVGLIGPKESRWETNKRLTPKSAIPIQRDARKKKSNFEMSLNILTVSVPGHILTEVHVRTIKMTMDSRGLS